MRDLVVVSLEAWDEVWRRNQYLVDGLLRTQADLRVLFVEPAVDPLHALRRGARPRLGRGLRAAPAAESRGGRLSLLEPTKWLPRRLDRKADRRWASYVDHALRRLGMAGPRVWVNDPMGIELVERLRAPSVYDITDDWAAADRSPVELERTVAREDRLLAACEEVVVCSADLARNKGAHRNVTLIPNGVDVAAYRTQSPRPHVLPSGPIALYVGTLHRDRLDVGLTVSTAVAARGRGRVVLVGPVALPQEDVAALTAAGVLLLGAQDRRVVPALLQHASLLLVPHLVSAFTDSLDPIKSYEYAAAGRPVVSTPVAGFREDTSGRVTIAEAAEFPAEVSRALDAGWVPSIHHAEDESADWGSRVRHMAAVLDRLENA